MPSTSNSSTDPAERRRLLVGRIGRAHGLDGAVVVRLISDRAERLDVGSRLWTSGDSSSDVGLVVERARCEPKRWVVRFADVSDRSGAEALNGTELWAEAIDEPGVMWVDDLVGCSVVDGDGQDRGRVMALLANPASDLLELDSGALVPIRFVVDGPTEGIVRVVVPEGLWDL